MLRRKTMMKASIGLALVAGLLATAGCQSYVLVTVQVPESLNATSVRVVRTPSEGTSLWMKDEPLTREKSRSGFVIFQVGVPSEAVGLTLVVQAMSDQELLAEAKLLVTNAIGQTITLSPCANALKRDKQFQSCQPATPPMTTMAPVDGGIDGLADAGGDTETEPMPPPPGDAGGDSGGRACLVADPEAPLRPLPTVSMLSAACQTYCAAMQQNCASVYGTAARCWYACDLLGWPAMGDFMQDTIDCRTSHAQTTASDPVTRDMLCRAASPVLTTSCGDVCAVFCRSGVRICPGSFPDETTCRSGCEAERDRFDQKVKENPDAAGSHDFFSQIRCRMDRLQTAIFNRTYCDVAAPNKQCGECPNLDFRP